MSREATDWEQWLCNILVDRVPITVKDRIAEATIIPLLRSLYLAGFSGDDAILFLRSMTERREEIRRIDVGKLIEEEENRCRQLRYALDKIDDEQRNCNGGQD